MWFQVFLSFAYMQGFILGYRLVAAVENWLDFLSIKLVSPLPPWNISRDSPTLSFYPAGGSVMVKCVVFPSKVQLIFCLYWIKLSPAVAY